ncbi:MAG: hypothetical protein K6F05_02515 [Succinivibrio sp.]|nr:hypothetical protein [Succinivibrio sp.]
MKKFISILCAAFLAVSALSGCTTVTPVSSIVYATPAGSSASLVRQGIVEAAKTNGWTLRENGKQSFLITKSDVKFTATSRIDYRASQYEITYVKSSLSSEDGKVPQAYNDWVTELNTSIQNAIVKIRNPGMNKSTSSSAKSKAKPRAKKK